MRQITSGSKSVQEMIHPGVLCLADTTIWVDPSVSFDCDGMLTFTAYSDDERIRVGETYIVIAVVKRSSIKYMQLTPSTDVAYVLSKKYMGWVYVNVDEVIA